ncbi:helix-turn-helix domain-containing protein [Streptomyces sp. NPDC044984]|uniref:TetR/AcrR family transcriptional regulator n=1 Tax=Streptomyces sp. NPDC044984 TaxID=3154335 RepID=UPI0033F1641C
MELFAERGFEAISTRVVATAVGPSPALVTRHFGTKEGSRAAVDEHVLDRIAEQPHGLHPDKRVMASPGGVSVRVFGTDPVPRGCLRHALLEDSAASTELFGRLLSGARAEAG